MAPGDALNPWERGSDVGFVASRGNFASLALNLHCPRPRPSTALSIEGFDRKRLENARFPAFYGISPVRTSELKKRKNWVET